MIGVSKVNKNKKIDLSPYVNESTNQYMLDELDKSKDLSVTVQEGTNTSVVSYSDYSVISTEAIIMLGRILNNSDLANVIKMSITVKTPLSILYNDSIPHTNYTLQRYLEIKSESMFIGLIKRLMKAGVLYQIKGLIHGDVRVIYIINPYICRKRKVFENQILDIFEQFKADLNKLNE
jgi:hypothetical protein